MCVQGGGGTRRLPAPEDLCRGLAHASVSGGASAAAGHSLHLEQQLDAVQRRGGSTCHGAGGAARDEHPAMRCDGAPWGERVGGGQ